MILISLMQKAPMVLCMCPHLNTRLAYVLTDIHQGLSHTRPRTRGTP